MARNAIESDFRSSKMAQKGLPKWRPAAILKKKSPQKKLHIDLKWREMRSKVIFGHPKCPAAAILRKFFLFATFSHFSPAFPTYSNFSPLFQLFTIFSNFSSLFTTFPHFSPTFHHFSPLFTTFRTFSHLLPAFATFSFIGLCIIDHVLLDSGIVRPSGFLFSSASLTCFFGMNLPLYRFS